jgi:2-polyprenyl-3-methyl-5-hydroxy-6-metoxy-1,4-benzoquinol methylase
MKTCLSLYRCKANRKILFVKNGYAIQECTQCHHRFAFLGKATMDHLLQVYSNAYFFDGKSGYPNYLEERDILVNHGKRYARLLLNYTTPGKILDVGSAAGFILKGFESSGWECYGVEPNESMAAYGLKELGLTIQTGSLESYNNHQKFDLITFIQVIGHFYDLDLAIQNARKLLKPDGLILVESWNRKSAIAKFLGNSWHEYSPPSVIHWFSDDTLKELFRFYRFNLVEQGRPKKQIQVKHALSLLEEKTPGFFKKRQLFNFANRKIGGYKIYYPPIDLKWYLFKKDIS